MMTWNGIVQGSIGVLVGTREGPASGVPGDRGDFAQGLRRPRGCAKPWRIAEQLLRLRAHLAAEER